MIFQALGGIFVFTMLAFLLSEKKRAVPWGRVAICYLIAVIGGALLMFFPFLETIFSSLNQVVSVLDRVTQEASGFLFGYLGGGKEPFQVVAPENNFVIAFRVFPLILVVGVLSNLLYHFRILPFMIGILSRLIRGPLKLSGDLAFAAMASIFFGTIETPLVIRPRLATLTRGELLALLVCTMSTIAGTVMVLYAKVLSPVIPDILGHLLKASFLSVPVALALSFVVCPPGEEVYERDDQDLHRSPWESAFAAFSSGITEGITMILQITATILVLVALVNLGNVLVGFLSPGLTIQEVLSFPLKPLLWLTGLSWEEAGPGARLMATKIVLNEFVAYLLMSGEGSLSEQGKVILSYALCGFANLGSLGIVVGGLSGILPERKLEIAKLGLYSLYLGNLATLITAAIYAFLRSFQG